MGQASEPDGSLDVFFPRSSVSVRNASEAVQCCQQEQMERRCQDLFGTIDKTLLVVVTCALHKYCTDSKKSIDLCTANAD